MEVEWVCKDAPPSVMQLLQCIDTFQPFFRSPYPIGDNLYHLYKYVNRPRVLQKTDRINNYMYSHKIDGLHKLVCSNNMGAVNTVGIDGVVESLGSSTNQSWVVETEYILGQYIVLDILFYNGYQVYDSHAIRMARIELLDFTMIKKQFVSELRDLTATDYPTDGLILTSTGHYKEPIFKHKEGKHLTIDFLIRVQAEYADLYLSNNVNGTVQLVKYSQIINKDYNNEFVYECYFDGQEWIPVRHREDKTGNMHYMFMLQCCCCSFIQKR